MELVSRNFSFQVVELTEDTVFDECNLTLTRLNRNGYHEEFINCNTAGLYLDGVKQDDFVWARYEPQYDEDGNFLGDVLMEERS